MMSGIRSCPALLLCVVLAISSGCSHSVRSEASGPSALPPFAYKLVLASSRNESLEDTSPWTMEPKASAADTEQIVRYITEHPDLTSYHLLMYLRYADGRRYKVLPDHLKAEVLCSALASTPDCADFALLLPTGSTDKMAGRALAETGSAAIPYLAPLLSDNSCANFYGGREYQVASHYKYRRADFAYHYIMLGLGKTPDFSAECSARDVGIAKLQDQLAEMMRHGQSRG